MPTDRYFNLIHRSEPSMGSDAASSDSVLDLENALARLGGDRELFAEMAGYLFEDAPKLIGELCAVLDAKDATTVRMKSHALKGLLAGCGGVRAARLAQELEHAGESGNLSQAATLANSLVSEVEKLTQALHAEVD